MSGAEMLALADRLSAGKTDADTIKFSECFVPGGKGYQWGAVTSTSPRLARLFCDVWNARDTIAAALRALAKDQTNA